MILSEYEAKRMDLEKKMNEINEREAEHMITLLGKLQAENKKISSQMGQLKKRRGEVLQKYKADKSYVRKMYKEEKQQIQLKMHTLRMEYLTLNGIDEKSRNTPPSTGNGGDGQSEKGGIV